MKPKARVFVMASQSILVVFFLEIVFACACERWMQVQLTPVLEFQEQSKKSLL